jgi:hypothetical protein
MSPARFKPEIPASEQPQTHTFDREATCIGMKVIRLYLLLKALSVRGAKIIVSLV